jgi:ABC-type tungstate transport system permease subunit
MQHDYAAPMTDISTVPYSSLRRGGNCGRLGTPRRLLAAPLVGLLVTAAVLLTPGLASADSSSSLTVVGTSDLSDSGLIPTLIQPAFHAAFPQFTFKYIGTATGTAINDAESGSAGASVLIVHAESLENQFVASGFSFEPYGRAIFTNDFVLAGPTGDPAGVGADGAHNVVQAFADVATAGINGGGTPKATFVSRGGTSGTTVEEHKIWAMVAAMATPPTGLLLCTVNSTDGGGETPIAAGNGVTASGQACPNSGALPTGSALPPWYVATGLTQGPNVVAANACNGYPSGPNSCYVLTDRGTFDYAASGLDPAGAIPGLKIVTRDDSPSAPGGQFFLTNYFHAYIINPNKPDEQVNLTAAQDLLNFLTSPIVQSQLRTYLDDTSDPGGAPFVADASPEISVTSGFPSTVAAGHTVTVTGTLTNAEPGYPSLSGKTVSVDELLAGVPVRVASGTTNSAGGFSIAFTPPSSGSYELATGQIQQIENSQVNPVFGDILSPAATSPSSMSVQASIAIINARGSAGGASVTGSVSPAAPDGNANVTILARRQGSTGAFTQVGGESLTGGQGSYAANAALLPGKWQLEATYTDPGELLSATSSTVNVTVPSSSTTVRFKKLKVRKGHVTLTGTLSAAPSTAGATVQLYAMRTAKLGKSGSTKSVRMDVVARAAVSFPRVGKTSIGRGKTKFTIRAKLKRGYRYVLQLKYAPKGASSSYSRLKSLTVR